MYLSKYRCLRTTQVVYCKHSFIRRYTVSIKLGWGLSPAKRAGGKGVTIRQTQVKESENLWDSKGDNGAA
jgi:hypothetical protein